MKIREAYLEDFDKITLLLVHYSLSDLRTLKELLADKKSNHFSLKPIK